MNEKIKIIAISFCIGLLIGSIGMFAGVYFYTKSRFDNYEKLIESARVRIEQAELTNKYLASELERATNLINELTTVIERSNGTVNSLDQSIVETSRINRRIREILSKYLQDE